MSRSRNQNRKTVPKATPSTPVVNPHAAGIDVGSDSMYVSVPIDSSPTPVAKFGAFTADLLEIAAWLKKCNVRTVAMESTGVYWIPLYEILEQHGFDVCLVSPNYPKNPRKTDVQDCQWLQYLHSVGLLKGAFRPNEEVCAVRAVLRCRAVIVSEASSDILRMQKSLVQMNLLLHNVISDISGLTGLAIIDAILSGQRDPKILALLRDARIRARPEEIEKSLEGNYRAEHLFTLRQARESYAFHQKQIIACDAQIKDMLKCIGGDPPQDAPADGKRKPQNTRNLIRLPGGDLRSEMARLNGVDLTRVPGIGSNIVCAVFSEVGTDISKFSSPSAFASWLRLCPDPRISGGKVLGKSAYPAKSRIAGLLRQAAQSLSRSETYLGQFYRRMKAKLGPPAATKAVAHKLARIIYIVLKTKQPYDEAYFAIAKERNDQKRRNRIIKDALALGLTITGA